MLKEKERGKSTDFRAAKRDNTLLGFVFIWTVSPHLAKVPNEKSLPVSAAELMKVLLAPRHGTSDLRLKHPLKKPDFTLLTTGSTEGDYASPRSVRIKYMNFF